MNVKNDLRQVTVWLRCRYSVRHVHIWITRHYCCGEDQISQVKITTMGRSAVELASAAKKAFEALGYTINDTGADTYAIEETMSGLSQHEVLKAYARVDAALNKAKCEP